VWEHRTRVVVLNLPSGLVCIQLTPSCTAFVASMALRECWEEFVGCSPTLASAETFSTLGDKYAQTRRLLSPPFVSARQWANN
jgi:hypothetical protein